MDCRPFGANLLWSIWKKCCPFVAIIWKKMLHHLRKQKKVVKYKQKSFCCHENAVIYLKISPPTSRRLLTFQRLSSQLIPRSTTLDHISIPFPVTPLSLSQTPSDALPLRFLWRLFQEIKIKHGCASCLVSWVNVTSPQSRAVQFMPFIQGALIPHVLLLRSSCLLPLHCHLPVLSHSPHVHFHMCVVRSTSSQIYVQSARGI